MSEQDPVFGSTPPPPAAIASPSAAAGAGGFDLWRFYSALMKRLWLVGVIFVVTVASVSFWTFRQVRIYRAEASVVIDLMAPQVLKNMPEVVPLGEGNYWSTKEYFETQYRVMRSRSIAEKVVTRLGLDRDDDFLHVPAGLTEAQRAKAREAADPVQMVIEKIAVLPVKDSRVVTISIEDANPRRAADLANAVAEEYIEQNVDRKMETTHGASAFLAEQLVILKKNLEASERALYQFKVDHDVLTTSLEARHNIPSENTVTINGDLQHVVLKRTQLEARHESLVRILEASKAEEFQAESFKPVADNTVIGDRKRLYFQLRDEKVVLSQVYLPGHPKLAAVEERIKLARADIIHEITMIIRQAEEELAQARDEEGRLRRLLESAKHDAIAINQLEVQHDLLKREKDHNQQAYELMSRRHQEVDFTGLLRTNNIRTLDLALVPKVPSRPNRTQNIMLSVVLGLILGVAFVLLLEFLDSTVKSQDDVESSLGLPLLGILPSIPPIQLAQLTARDSTAQRDLYVSANPKSSISECARAIRTSLLFASPDRPFKVLLIASCGPREGKSTCAVSIGITMAQAGQRVLVVDGDLRRPRLHRTFGASSTQGLSTLILGEATPEEAIKSTGVGNLYVLPAGPVPPNPAELLQSARFTDVLRQLTDRFDRVVIDSPPVGVVTDALVMAAQADGVVMVLRAGNTPKKAASRGRRALLDVKAHIYGAVLNDVDLGSRAGQYYYYYRYGYYPSDKYPTPTGGGPSGGPSGGSTGGPSGGPGGPGESPVALVADAQDGKKRKGKEIAA